MKGEEFPDHLVNDLTIAMHNHLVSHTHTHSYSNEISESERRKVMVHMIVCHLLPGAGVKCFYGPVISR